jgi:phosphonate transport system substrate-binding protein
MGMICWLLSSVPLLAQDTTLSFGVMPQRTITLNAQYWNPILHYVNTHSGIHLAYRPNKNTAEHAAMIREGAFDFAYSNYFFIPEYVGADYQVVVRPAEAAIRGDIVVLETSPIQSLKELDGKVVGFPHKAAFVGYLVTYDKLLHEGINVEVVFGGNQEGIMGQLKAGRVVAAGVNSQVMRDFAEREKLSYRVLWRSQDYYNIPIIVHPRITQDKVEAVRAALLQMSQDPEGLRILKESAALIKLDPPYGFVASGAADYENTRLFFQNALVHSE